MKYVFISLLMLTSIVLWSQDTWNSLMTREVPEQYRVHSILYRLGKYAQTSPNDALNKAIEQRIIMRSDNRINVEVVYGTDLTKSINADFLREVGFEVANTWKNRASCWIEIVSLLQVCEHLTAPYIVLPVTPPVSVNEGPAVTNSIDYITNGADGNGIVIAVIDNGFIGLTAAIAAGAAPVLYIGFDWVGDGLQLGDIHGTACVETVFDHAPGAGYQLHRIVSATDFGNAIDAAIMNGVDIISHSLAWYNQGWGDNSGSACSAVEDATNAGVLFFTAAGNEHGKHWQGDFEDDDNDKWHEWLGSDEENSFTVNPFSAVDLALQWDGASVVNYYNLYLYDDQTDELLESSTSIFTFESLFWINLSADFVDVYVKIKKPNSSPTTSPEFELFNNAINGDNFEYMSLSGSTASPSNSTEPLCISVGAVHFQNYNSPPGANALQPFSSRGPTNSGNQAPDIVGPSSTTTIAYSGAFTGTSCAAPNAAGAAAAFWSGNTNLSVIGVREILFRKAELYNDWGATGTDNLYGHGGLELFDHLLPTRYVYSLSNNPSGTSSLPYENMEDADDDAPSNARIVFLGGTYDAPGTGYVFDKPLVYISLINSSAVR